MISNREVRGGLNRQWFSLRGNIDRLAAAFNLPGVGSNFTGSYRDYSQRNPDQRYPNQGYPDQRYPNQGYPDQVGNLPNWAIGTFRGVTTVANLNSPFRPTG